MFSTGHWAWAEPIENENCSQNFEIRKKHNILNINGIIQIVYNYEEIITKEEFDKYKIENKCEIKGDINEFKENIKLN